MRASSPVMSYFGDNTLPGGTFILVPNSFTQAGSPPQQSGPETSPEETTGKAPGHKFIVVPKELPGKSYQSALSDADINTGISKVTELLQSNGLSVVNYSPNTPSATEAELVKNSGADMYIEVGISKHSQSQDGTNAVTLTLTEIDAKTGQLLYTKSNLSGYFRGSDNETLTARALRDISNEFITAIMTVVK